MQGPEPRIVYRPRPGAAPDAKAEPDGRNDAAKASNTQEVSLQISETS